EYGIFIIVDAIPNHTTAYWDAIDPALTGHQPSLFHSRQGQNMLSNVWASPMDFGDRRSFVRGNLLGLWDFATGNPDFQQIYMAFLGTIIDAGASGFRYDAMHHIELPNDPPDIASDFWPIISTFVDERVHALGRIPFQYGEILGGGYRANHYLHGLYDHANVLITPYAFSRSILGALDMGALRDGQDGWNSDNFHVRGNPRDHADGPFGPAFVAVDLDGFEGFAQGVVPWVESHDQYGNDGMSRHLTDAQLIVGWALIAARQGTSPLFFVRPGERFINSGNMFVPQDDGSFLNRWGHQQLFRDPAVAAINWLANDFIDAPELATTHGTVAMVQRGAPGRRTGAVLANVGANPAPVLLPVELINGAYTCAITGEVYTVQDGWLTGPAIPAMSVLVLRDPSGDMPADAAPLVSVYPLNDSGVFYGEDGMVMTLIAMHTDSQYVRITINGTVVEDTHFTHGMPMTIAADAAIGDHYVVTIRGIKDGTVVSQEFAFTKIEVPEPSGIRVEYVRNQNPWDRAGIWAWGGQGDVFSGGWPGPEMEWVPRLDGEGYAWVFYLPEDTPVPVTLIFNNFGEGEQTTPYLTIMESTRVFQIGDGQEIGDVEPIR
ncbi:MAG: alpha-amylase family glycosyl hydrolase, partial [Defluviitaleaceae bacterium]|nr:alpha-amylase family glycosyl hydrolase [Defluviitaleaceae bacterium]